MRSILLLAVFFLPFVTATAARAEPCPAYEQAISEVERTLDLRVPLRERQQSFLTRSSASSTQYGATRTTTRRISHVSWFTGRLTGNLPARPVTPLPVRGIASRVSYPVE